MTNILEQSARSLGENVIDPKGSMMIDTNFKITYHCMDQFTKLLDANNLNFNLIERSLSPFLNREQALQAGEGSGKSGSFFFFSHDKQFIIKTMKVAEKKALLHILPQYVSYLIEHPHSMLCKIYGVFTLKRAWMAPVVVMLMENTIQTKSGDWSKMFATFDLKGSTHGRQVVKRDKNGVKKRIQPSTVQKDLDFLEAKDRNQKLFIMDELNRKLQNVLL